MSLHRFVACQRLGLSAKNVGLTGKFNPGHLIRWQSSAPTPKNSRVFRNISTVVVASGVVTIGVLSYANYNPVFKNRVNETIPGFSALVDEAADVYVSIKDYFNPKPLQKKVDLVREYNEGKSKGYPAQPRMTQHNKTSGQEGGSRKIDEKSKRVTKDKDPEAKSIKEKQKTVEATRKPEVEVKPDKLKVSTKQEDVGGAKKDAQMKSQSTEKESKVPAKSPQEPQKASTAPTSSSDNKQVPVSSPVTQSDSSSPSSKAAEGDVVPKKSGKEESSVSEAKTEEAKTGETQKSDHVEFLEDGRLNDPAKYVEVLDELYKKFNSDCDGVKKAQKDLLSMWEKLYVVITLPDTEDKKKDQLVDEAKTATTLANEVLKKMGAECERSGLSLMKLVEIAEEKGYLSKGSTIASEMKVKEAEIDLGLLKVKEAIINANVADHYRESIRESRDLIKRDLETAMATIDPERRDSLLAALNKKVEILYHKLKASESEHARKLTIALEVQRRNLEGLTEKRVASAQRENEAKYKQRLTKEINELTDNYYATMREQLRLQNEAHTRHMNEALTDLKEELDSKWLSEMDVKLTEQESFYQVELAKTRSRLDGLESVIDRVIDTGKKTVELQSLRNACDGLIATLDFDSDDVTGRYALDTEVRTLREASHGDSFIQAILTSIPSQAISGEGIQSEATLRERFGKVKRICKRVALVPESGGGLGTYALSYVQSAFSINWWLPEESSINPSDLHTYDLLRHAEVRLNKGDLEGAVYYMNHLKGEPKNIARDWLKDMRLYLETRQAVQLIQTYMSANAVTTNQ